MMFSKIFGFCFLHLSFFCFLYADNSQNIELVRSLTQPEISEITEVKQGKDTKDVLISFSNISLKVGENGIIVRNLDSYEVIVANAEVVQVQDTIAIAKVTPFTQLAQPYLPTPRLKAQVGDKVIFRSFNDKAFLIAPNEETYRAVIAQYPFINFLNSDLLMGFLNSQGKHDPTRKLLPKACNEYGVGLVFIVGSKNIATFSCQNITQIDKYPNTPLQPEITHAPFYTRASFEGGGSLTYSLSSKKSRDYYKYYDEFIGDLVNPKDSKK